MREHRARNDGILAFQTTDNLFHVLLRVKTQTMHTRVKFDMNRPTGDTLLLCCMDERIHQSEGIYLRLQFVVEHGLEGRHLGVHDHDVLRDAVTTQLHTLVSHSHSQVVHAVVLQCLSHLHGTGTVGIGLHHADNLRFRL